MVPLIPGIGDTVEENDRLPLPGFDVVPRHALLITWRFHKVVGEFHTIEDLFIARSVGRSRLNIPKVANAVGNAAFVRNESFNRFSRTLGKLRVCEWAL